MKTLSKKLSDSIDELENGNLEIADLEILVEEARELYERLLIVKYKAYEKYGEPKATVVEEVPEVVDMVEEEAEVAPPIVEEVVKEDLNETEPEIEEAAFDFSGITEKMSVEQPSFDFSEMTNPTVESATSEEEKIEQETKPVHKESIQSDDDDENEEEDSNSLNASLKDEDEELSLRKKLQSTPVTDLKAEISIAKKFEYIRFMFDGDSAIYDAAIKALNTCSDVEEAKNKLNNYSTKHKWDLENKSIIKFVELVERRYL